MSSRARISSRRFTRDFRGPAAILLAVIAVGGCTPADMSDAERQIVLTAADFVPYGFPPPTGPEDETWDGWRWFDGSREIEYTYETLFDGGPSPFSLYVSVAWETSYADAVASYAASRLGFRIGSEAGSIERLEVTDSCDYADRCALFLIAHQEQPVGNQFILQAGGIVYSVQIVGLYFDDPELWHEIIAPKVAPRKSTGSKPRPSAAQGGQLRPRDVVQIRDRSLHAKKVL